MIVLIKKYNCVNLFRFLMAICVISIHTNPLANVNNIYLIRLNESIVRLAVPFFFLVTGFFIGKKMHDINKYSKIDNNIIKKSKNKNLKYFFIFTLIYLPITFYYYFNSEYSVLSNIYNFFQGLFLTGEHYNSWILWYLLSIIYGLLLIEILNKKNYNIKKIIIIGLILYLFSYMINIIVDIDTDINIVKILKKIISYTVVSGRIFTSVSYLSIGMYISKDENKFRNKKNINILLFILLLFLNILTPDIFNEFFILPSAVIIFIIIINVNLKDNKIYEILKFFSEKMYFWHLYIYTLICMIISHGSIEHIYGFNMFGLCLFFTIVLSIVFYIFEKCRILNFKKKEGIT